MREFSIQNIYILVHLTNFRQLTMLSVEVVFVLSVEVVSVLSEKVVSVLSVQVIHMFQLKYVVSGLSVVVCSVIIVF